MARLSSSNQDGARRRRPISLNDVAKKAGVHPGTASRALDPSKMSLVRPGTRVRVEMAARSLGYRADVVARSLRVGQTMTVGVVVADLENIFLPPMLRGISLALERTGFMALITETRDGHERLRAALENLVSRRVDAIIVTGARLADAPLLEDIARQRLPVVLAVRPLRATLLPSVTSDDVSGGAIAAEHFAALGHERVAELVGPSDAQPFIDRSRGFSDAADRLGLRVVLSSAEAAQPTVSEGARLLRPLLEGADERPTAVFAHNDEMAIGAIDALRAAGLNCPRDVSVLGYNDSPLVDHFSPSLSTIRFPSAEIGRFAAELAVALVGDPSATPASTTFPPQLVARGSTAPLSPFA